MKDPRLECQVKEGLDFLGCKLLRFWLIIKYYHIDCSIHECNLNDMDHII